MANTTQAMVVYTKEEVIFSFNGKILWKPCAGCIDSPWPGIIYPINDIYIEACNDCHIYVYKDIDEWILDDYIASKALQYYLRATFNEDFELVTDEWGTHFVSYDEWDYTELLVDRVDKAEPTTLLCPVVHPAYAAVLEEKLVTPAQSPNGVIYLTDEQGYIKILENQNSRLWNLLKRTRRHRDSMLCKVRDELARSRLREAPIVVEAAWLRNHNTMLHQLNEELSEEINTLELRKNELKAAILMMGGELK